MAIRKILLPLATNSASEAALATAFMVANRWKAHVTAVHIPRKGSDQVSVARSLFEQFAARHDVVIQQEAIRLDQASAEKFIVR